MVPPRTENATERFPYQILGYLSAGRRHHGRQEFDGGNLRTERLISTIAEDDYNSLWCVKLPLLHCASPTVVSAGDCERLGEETEYRVVVSTYPAHSFLSSVSFTGLPNLILDVCTGFPCFAFLQRPGYHNRFTSSNVHFRTNFSTVYIVQNIHSNFSILSIMAS